MFDPMLMGLHGAETMRAMDTAAIEGLGIPGGHLMERAGLAVAGLPWPGPTGLHARRSDRIAWSQALALSIRRVGKPEPLIVVSHIPPLDAGDVPDGGFHRGLHAYRWLMDRVSPRLWLHGHTPLAATPKWRLEVGGTTVVNATGAVLISLLPPDRDD